MVQIRIQENQIRGDPLQVNRQAGGRMEGDIAHLVGGTTDAATGRAIDGYIERSLG